MSDREYNPHYQPHLPEEQEAYFHGYVDGAHMLALKLFDNNLQEHIRRCVQECIDALEI